jgi:hypothetical protein
VDAATQLLRDGQAEVGGRFGVEPAADGEHDPVVPLIPHDRDIHRLRPASSLRRTRC